VKGRKSLLFVNKKKQKNFIRRFAQLTARGEAPNESFCALFSKSAASFSSPLPLFAILSFL
jgi:hypothetical protein